MLARRLLLQSRLPRPSSLCLVCAAWRHCSPLQPEAQARVRPFSSSNTCLALRGQQKARKRQRILNNKKKKDGAKASTTKKEKRGSKAEEDDADAPTTTGEKDKDDADITIKKIRSKTVSTRRSGVNNGSRTVVRRVRASLGRKSEGEEVEEPTKSTGVQGKSLKEVEQPTKSKGVRGKSLKEALLGTEGPSRKKGERKKKSENVKKLDIEELTPENLEFRAVDVDVPPVPMLSYGLDRVLFNPGVYRLQDPRSRVYNFDPYLEKIMAVNEFDFAALSEYKTSSKDKELLAMTQRLGTKFTGSTSSMSGVLQHFHYLLSNFRQLNHEMLSRNFPRSSTKFSKITLGPSAAFLRWKDGVYAIDADKSYDRPNIMSWLGHSLEKLLTTERGEFERYRRSSPGQAPSEDNSSRCYHYSTLGNFLMRSQLDAHDPRLPGTGVFDLKTRAVVSIRMDHKEYETGSGYQLRYDRGEWESYEREFHDMTRATMLKYSLQVRMGRMDGIFVAYHNIARIFGFQYLSLSDLDNVLHGQTDSCLGDQEFKLSVRLLDEVLQKAIEKFPETTLRLHFHTRQARKEPFMYIFAEPVTEERADEIQNALQAEHKAFERDIVGVQRDDPEIQAEWQDIQSRVDDEVDEDEFRAQASENKRDNDTDNGEESTEDADDQTSEESFKAQQEATETSNDDANKLLIGWTLALRNRVNGCYVERPEKLEPSDTWTVEYHIKEMGEVALPKLYEQVKTERQKLIGEDRTEQKGSLRQYLSIIKKYSERGRKWREEQDKIDEKVGQQMYRPLGPGSAGETSAKVD